MDNIDKMERQIAMNKGERVYFEIVYQDASNNHEWSSVRFDSKMENLEKNSSDITKMMYGMGKLDDDSEWFIIDPE